MTIEELLKDAKDWWKAHAEREIERKETLVSRFETAVKRMEQLYTLVNVDKRWSIKVSNKVPAVPWRNDIGASGLMISPQNGTDLTNISISANGVTYTFPAGSTAATVIPLGLPGDVIAISGTSATLAVMDLRALGQEETLRFLMRPFGSTVIVGNTVNAKLTGSSAPDSAAAPTNVLSVSYSAFTANTTKFIGTPAGTLHRNAKRRAVTLVNNGMGIATGQTNVAVQDSAVGAFSQGRYSAAATTVGSGNQMPYGTDDIPELALAADELWVSVAIGATAPTAGTFDVWLAEVL